MSSRVNVGEISVLKVRVQAIRGLPLFCKDTPEHLAKIVDILGQLLIAGNLVFNASVLILKVNSAAKLIKYFLWLWLGDNVERDAVHKALMSLLRQDVKSKSQF